MSKLTANGMPAGERIEDLTFDALWQSFRHAACHPDMPDYVVESYRQAFTAGASWVIATYLRSQELKSGPTRIGPLMERWKAEIEADNKRSMDGGLSS